MSAGARRLVPDDLFGGRLRGCSYLDLEVVAVVDHSAQLRTITFRSSDLVDFDWRPGQDLMFEVPGAAAGTRRRYTIRRGDPVAGTLDIDVVMHGHGPFATWAAGVEPGDRIEAIGPRGAIELADATHHLFVADESALAITFALVEALPAGTGATAIVVTDGAVPAVPSPVADVRWIAADDLERELAATVVPAGSAAYVHGERSLVRTTVAQLTARGVDNITSKPYWRRDQANAAHGEPGRD